jgi:hypothetical protein
VNKAPKVNNFPEFLRFSTTKYSKPPRKRFLSNDYNRLSFKVKGEGMESPRKESFLPLMFVYIRIASLFLRRSSVPKIASYLKALWRKPA